MKLLKKPLSIFLAMMICMLGIGTNFYEYRISRSRGNDSIYD